MIMTTAGVILFGTWLFDKIKDKGFDSVYSKLTSVDELDMKFTKCVELVSSRLQEKYPEILGGRMDYFFKTEPVYRELVKLLFVSSKVNIDIISEKFDITTLPPDFILEFVKELSKELLEDQELEKIVSNRELFVLINGISNDVETIANNSSLTLDEIQSIKKLIEERIIEKFSFDDFWINYSKNALNNLSQINFIGLGVGADISRKINRKHLEDVFVNPKFELIKNEYLIEKTGDKDFSYEEEFEYKSLFEFGNKIVVLGNPGSGKSVLIRAIICSILEKKESFKNITIQDCIPFRIELRKYLAFKKQYRGNFIKYLNSLLEEEYSIQNMTEKQLDKILTEKSSILFFDGLDEIFKIEDKIEIKNDIEIFHNSYELTRSITTSRLIGYEEARLNQKEFCELNIQNFDDNQISEYLHKWYEKEESLEERRRIEISGFLEKKHEIDNELVSNPLLLSLIVIIYRNTLTLPESKLEIYKSCTKTLVDKWDASKTELEIGLEESVYSKRENILADLAYWQYNQLSSENISITFEKAQTQVMKSIERFKIKDELESYNFAENFMSYAQKRSIYFENNFTHKTFLEYYTAFWIYSNIEKKNRTQDRNELISKYIDNSFWHIVLELLLNMIDKDQADTDMMDELIEYQLANNIGSLPFLLTTIMSYKNVGKHCITKVVSMSVDFLVQEYKRFNFERSDTFHSRVYESLKQLYSNKNGKEIVLSKLREIESTSLGISELVYCLYQELDYMTATKEKNFQFELTNINHFEQSKLNNEFLFISSCYMNEFKHGSDDFLKLSTKFIEQFGPDKFSENIPFYFHSTSYLPMTYFYFRRALLKENIKLFESNLECLFSLGVSTQSTVDFICTGFLYSAYDNDINGIIEKLDSMDNGIYSYLLCLIIFNTHSTRGKFKDYIKGLKNEAFLLDLCNTRATERFDKISKYYNQSFTDKSNEVPF